MGEEPAQADIQIDGIKNAFRHIKRHHVVFAVLLFIVIFGIYLRSYHAGYPVIGYHNWKETHYLTEARNFAQEGFFKWGFFVPEYDYFQGMEGPEGQHADGFPLTSIVVGVLFKIFGDSLLLARWASILISGASIVVMFLFTKKLFERDDVALTAAALMAIMPLLVFFGRQVQLEPYSCFLILLSAYFFLLWLDAFKMRWLALAALSVSVGFLVRYDHFTILFGFLFIFPFKKLLDKKFLWRTLVSLLPAIIVPAWLLYMKIYGQEINSPLVPEGINPSVILTSTWWQAVTSYIRDNYTMLGFWIAVIGLGFLLLLFFTNRQNRAYRFIFGLFVGFFPWLYIAALYLGEHAYHQYPIVPMMVLLQTITIMVVSSYAAKIVKIPAVKPVLTILIIVLLFTGFSSVEGTKDATARVFNTQFPGLDIAGQYIYDHSTRADRIMHTSGQGYGLMWHADRKGYKLPTDPADIQKLEAKGADWIFMYNWGFDKFQNENFTDYVSNNYALAQVAFVQTANGAQPIYFLFKKGGTSNMSMTALNDWVKSRPIKTKDYEYTTGPYTVSYTA